MKNPVLRSRVIGLALGAIAGSGLFAQAAEAAYTGPTLPCRGTSIDGVGTSSLNQVNRFAWGADRLSLVGWPAWTLGSTPIGNLIVQDRAETGFGFAGNGTGSCGSFRSQGKTIGYAPTGSGGGRNSWVANGTTPRDATAAFTATDEAPSMSEEANMEWFGLVGPTNLLTIPVAQSAIAVIVNLPDGCTLASDSYRKATLANIEKIMWGEKVTWGSLLGSSAALVGTPTPGGGTCRDKAIKRVVPRDSSGTTHAFKQVLNVSVNNRWETEPWKQISPTNPTSVTDEVNFMATANNTAWPNVPGVTAAYSHSNIKSIARADYGEADAAWKAIGTDSSISFADLATARWAGFGYYGTSDDRFWLQVTAPSGGSSVVTNDPAKDPAEAPDVFGANCSSQSTGRDYGSLPAEGAKGNWNAVTGAKARFKSGEYPICALTYVLAYDNYSVTPTPEPQARTVSDFVKYMTGTGQTLLAAADYQALPTVGPNPLRPIAVAGANAIDY
ncbi:MAG: substrate-binding domain-containing protein [Solirubrobacteraceae bacterium]|nr:substrate-binding domain-containing protein [Solirubrobacteraceae bacterium]